MVPATYPSTNATFASVFSFNHQYPFFVSPSSFAFVPVAHRTRQRASTIFRMVPHCSLQVGGNVISSTTTVNYLYDGDDIEEEVDPSGVVVAQYCQGRNRDEPLAMLRGGVTNYYEADGLGSITSLKRWVGIAHANIYICWVQRELNSNDCNPMDPSPSNCWRLATIRDAFRQAFRPEMANGCKSLSDGSLESCRSSKELLLMSRDGGPYHPDLGPGYVASRAAPIESR